MNFRRDRRATRDSVDLQPALGVLHGLGLSVLLVLLAVGGYQLFWWLLPRLP